MSVFQNVQYWGVNTFIIISYLFYFSIIIGVAIINPETYKKVDLIVKIYIAIFLIIRFRPFRGKSITFTELDRKIAFQAGIFIFMTVIVHSMFDKYIDYLKVRAKNILPHSRDDDKDITNDITNDNQYRSVSNQN